MLTPAQLEKLCKRYFPFNNFESPGFYDFAPDSPQQDDMNADVEYAVYEGLTGVTDATFIDYNQRSYKYKNMFDMTREECGRLCAFDPGRSCSGQADARLCGRKLLPTDLFILGQLLPRSAQGPRPQGRVAPCRVDHLPSVLRVAREDLSYVCALPC